MLPIRAKYGRSLRSFAPEQRHHPGRNAKIAGLRSVDLLMPLRGLAMAALTYGTAVLAVRALLLLSRDLAQTRFNDAKRNDG